MDGLKDVRPRSVCVSAYLPTSKTAVIFGGEVDPSDRGHEGAGGFENDVLLLDSATGAFQERIAPSITDAEWPEQRGWSDGDVIAASGDGNGGDALYIFGGLSGDDKDPRRLDDLWRLTLD
uniref:Uncharacterized protein n=1 Tax=Odontella aurita TaxID=265563 RepID=A0A7S4JKK6_9STRA|mmetsp:Transcript_48022/g.145062  ORF Transcript_48022/g.145062 Transcript_48022/m.145062 type:complete len:121 (+) Transcript_48022:59-421(+)